MRSSNRSDVGGMARCSEPVVDGSPDRAAPDRRLARPLVTGDQKEHAVAARYRLLEGPVNCAPCAVEGQAVQIDDSVRLDAAPAKAPIPACVERRSWRAWFYPSRFAGHRSGRPYDPFRLCFAC
jgi:hypothetical protein